MKYEPFLRSLINPVPMAVLKKWPYGHIRQLYGEHPELYSANKCCFEKALGGHTGIDIAGAHRTPIVAAHDGVVTVTWGQRDAQGGLEIWIESDPQDDKSPGDSKIQTSYSHLDEWIVTQGQRVTQGQVIGHMGNTGFVISGGTQYWGNAPAGKGTHLHFGLHELIKKTDAWYPRYVNVLRNTTDPLPWISETPDNPHGDLSGLQVILGNLLKYLERRRSA